MKPRSVIEGTLIDIIIIRLTDRAFLLLHSRYHQKNLELIINTLLNNDCPLSFILIHD